MDSWPETRLSLIGRLANPKDASAWRQFESCYQTAIYRFARSRSLQADEAMDVVQEVMLAVHRQAVRWEPSGRVGSFRAWLAETSRRLTLTAIRFRDRGKFEEVQGTDLVAKETEKGSDKDEKSWAFYSAVAMVERETNPSLWRAFWLTAVDGQAAQSVADQLGMRLGTVYSAKSRVLARIKQVVQLSDLHDAPAKPVDQNQAPSLREGTK